MQKILLCVALGLALPIAGCHTLQSSSDYYGISTAGKNIVFVIDISGSMEGKQEGTLQDRAQGEVADRAGREAERVVGGVVGRALGNQVRQQTTKLAGAKRELAPAIRGLEESSLFTILTFGENVQAWQNELVPSTSGNKSIAISYVNGLDADGGTPMLAALERAFRIPRTDAIFLMTDGQPTDATASEILSRVRSLNANRRVALYTIGLGPDQDEEFLAELARQNAGAFVRRE